MNKEKLKYSIETIQGQIGKFDSKANSLITIVGIVFAFSLGAFDAFKQFSDIEMTGNILIKYNWLIIFSILYFISFITELTFLILVIYPRKKQSGIRILNYYMDVATDVNEIKQVLSGDDEKEEEQLRNQLFANARICKNKHKFLLLSIWSLIPLFIFMFSLFFTAIIY